MRVIYSGGSELLDSIVFGRSGRQLECFVPSAIEWAQLNYGQGEGQIRALDCEWGFYYNEDTDLCLVLHDGRISVERAVDFVNAVGEKVFGDSFSSIFPMIVNDDPSYNK